MLMISVTLQNLSAEVLAESRKHVDDFREQYDKLVAEDKVMDRGFKREFNDVPAHYVDQLYKLFRRRPRWVLSYTCACVLSHSWLLPRITGPGAPVMNKIFFISSLYITH